jgi:hypothetical protein
MFFWFMYSPTACGTWSPCQEDEKNHCEQSSPAICEGPAFALIRNVLESTADFIEAKRMCDIMYPVRKLTCSDSMSLSVFCLANFRLQSIILVNDLHGQPAHLPVKVIERQLERVTHVLANGSGRPAESGHEPDLHFSLLGGCSAWSKREHCRSEKKSL